VHVICRGNDIRRPLLGPRWLTATKVVDERRDNDDCSFSAAVSVADDDVPARRDVDQHDTLIRYRYNARVINIPVVLLSKDCRARSERQVCVRLRMRHIRCDTTQSLRDV